MERDQLTLQSMRLESSRLKNNTVSNPVVRLHRLAIPPGSQQLLFIKEEVSPKMEEGSPTVDQGPHIQDEQEELCMGQIKEEPLQEDPETKPDPVHVSQPERDETESELSDEENEDPGKRGSGADGDQSKKKDKNQDCTKEQHWYCVDGMLWESEEILFTAVPGPLNSAAALESDKPVDFLELILTNELLQYVVDQTNLYAQQQIEAGPTSSRLEAWKPVDIPEMKTFLGLLFLTGLIVKPEMDGYWSTKEVLETPYFGKTMARNRFQIIMRFLHFADNTAVRNNDDRLYKVRTVLDILVNKFQQLYQPGQNISIDEITLLWRCKLSSMNHSMNSVDRFDKIHSYYPFVRKSYKWTTKFFIYMLQICLHNAFILYKAKNPQGAVKTMYAFQESLIEAWTTATKAYRVPYADRLSRLSANQANHFPVRHDPTPRNDKPSKKCKVCLVNKKRRETRFQCGFCRIPLCRVPCFQVYHDTLNYKQ